MRQIVAFVAAAALGCSPLRAQTPASGGPASGNPNLAVASVRMADGIRVSTLIGAGVYSDPATQLGTLDDLIMTPDHSVVLAIVAIGGLLGVGAKLVAVPIGDLKAGVAGKWMLSGATKESLTAMPAFTY